VLLLKFLTNRFKSIKNSFKKEPEISFTRSTFFLAITELFMVVLGILLALYIDRWNTTQNFEKQFEATLRIVQQNLESDIYNSDNVIAHYHARDSLRHDVMMNKFDREYYEKGISYWQQVIVFYNQYQVTTEGYNLLLDMKDEVPKKYSEIFKKIKKMYKILPNLEEYNKNFKKIIWNIHDELAYSYWFWIDSYYGTVSKEQIDFFMNDPYYKALVQKVVNASALLDGIARSHRIRAIDMYNDINEILGQVEDVPENITYILNDSISKKYIGKYKLVDGEMGTWFPKYYIQNSILEIGIKDSVLYLMKDKKYVTPLYYFNRIYQNRNYPIKNNHVFISSVGYYEFYKNGNLRIGAAGPETIWQKQ
tara:strand:- start:75 stop:1169 length:1095 start_codon:yes stop_codon:yes gene_type:complete